MLTANLQVWLTDPSQTTIILLITESTAFNFPYRDLQPRNSITDDSVQFPVVWKMKAAGGSEKNPLLSPERSYGGREGGVTVAPDSCRCISIATGSSPGLLLSVSSVSVSLCLPSGTAGRGLPQGWTWEDGADRHDPCAPGGAKVFLQISEMSLRCIVLPALMMESGSHPCFSV